ncbi:TPA: hypothetical protein N0F65_004328 [Lagenidium giganteum]|uniref:GCK domain-containing protein n=1 Tax=Lagenidium giganteum TaxID=4803 RepID=A0AAV2YJE9_9STRA|nr:TPA: hypothetical protein N0F65_004328 [Lagenidium giganteum]
MASFRRFLRPRSAAAALSVPAMMGALSARMESTPAEDKPRAAPRNVDFVGVFLAKDSAKQLKEQFAPKFATADDDTLFVVLKYSPTDKEKDAFAPLMGHNAKLHVQAYAEDSETQAVLVRVTTAGGEPIDYQDAELPHVTIASVDGTHGLNSGRSSVLLERLRASDKLEFVLKQDAAEWKGELPEFKSQHLPLFNPFPETQAEVRLVAGVELQGTVCLASTYDHPAGECTNASPKAECGFCKFMKAGPCGEQFTAWEACLDKCKKNGDDFIEKCGPQTLALRDCVDANPDYYHVLNESPEDEDSSKEEKKADDDKAAAATDA